MWDGIYQIMDMRQEILGGEEVFEVQSIKQNESLNPSTRLLESLHI